MFDAADILAQIETGKWKWMKVKRFKPEDHSDADRYAALEKHHVEETQFLVSVVDDLCRQLCGTTQQKPDGNAAK